MDKAEQSAREIARFDFYSNMFRENVRSIELAKKRLLQIKKQVNSAVEVVPDIPFIDYKFLIDSAEFVHKARRAVTNIYIVRYYMKG